MNLLKPLEVVYYWEITIKVQKLNNLRLLYNLKLQRRAAYQTLPKVLLWSVTARVASDLLKALSILLDATVRRSALDREDLKSYWKSQKDRISKWSTSFSNILLTTEKKTNRSIEFSHRPLSNILKYRDHMRLFNNEESKIPLDTYWKPQLVPMKVQTHSSSKSPLEYNQHKMQDQSRSVHSTKKWCFLLRISLVNGDQIRRKLRW